MFPETILHATSDSLRDAPVLLGLLTFVLLTLSCLTQKNVSIYNMLERLIILDIILDAQILSRKYLPLLNPAPDFERVLGQDLTILIPTIKLVFMTSFPLINHPTCSL